MPILSSGKIQLCITCIFQHFCLCSPYFYLASFPWSSPGYIKNRQVWLSLMITSCQIQQKMKYMYLTRLVPHNSYKVFLTWADILTVRTLYDFASNLDSVFSATEVFPVPTGPTSITGQRFLIRVWVKYWYLTVSTVGTISLKKGKLEEQNNGNLYLQDTCLVLLYFKQICKHSRTTALGGIISFACLYKLFFDSW